MVANDFDVIRCHCVRLHHDDGCETFKDRKKTRKFRKTVVREEQAIWASTYL